MGTGGGSGDPANFSNWQERDPLCFERYDTNSKSSYLTYIHMLNNQYHHPMLKVNDQLPPQARLEDTPKSKIEHKEKSSSILVEFEKVSKKMECKSQERMDTIRNILDDLQSETQTPTTDSSLLSKVLNNLEDSTETDLDQARFYLTSEVGNILQKVTQMSTTIKSLETEMQQSKVQRDKDGFIKSKKRKRHYEKNRDILEESQIGLTKKLKLVNREARATEIEYCRSKRTGVYQAC